MLQDLTQTINRAGSANPRDPARQLYTLPNGKRRRSESWTAPGETGKQMRCRTGQNRYPTFKYVTIGFSLSFDSDFTVSVPTGVWACVVSFAVACNGTKDSENPANQ